MQDTSSENTKTQTGLSETENDQDILVQRLTSDESRVPGFSASQFWERQRRNRLPVCAE